MIYHLVEFFLLLLLQESLVAVVQTVLLSHSANAFFKISWHGYKIHWRIPHDFILFFFWRAGVYGVGCITKPLE